MATQEYPKWMYGPNPGDARIFEKDDVVPKGWADHPDKVKKPKAGKKDEPPPAPTPDEEERNATIASLREAGVEIADDATDEEINAAIDDLTSHEEEK